MLYNRRLVNLFNCVRTFAILEPTQINALVISSPSPESLHVTWVGPSNCQVTDYIVVHELTVFDQCRQMSDQPQSSYTSALSITIDCLEAFSTYKVAVAGRLDGVEGEPRDGVGTTAELSECIFMNLNRANVDKPYLTSFPTTYGLYFSLFTISGLFVLFCLFVCLFSLLCCFCLFVCFLLFCFCF